MSTLAEIEAAIETLPASEIQKLTLRLNQRTRPAEVESAHDVILANADGCSVEDFFGAFNTGDPNSADNDRIDADLAREAGRGL